MDSKVIFKAKRLDNGEWIEGFFTKKKLTSIFVPVIERIIECDSGDYIESVEVDGNTLKCSTKESQRIKDKIKVVTRFDRFAWGDSLKAGDAIIVNTKREIIWYDKSVWGDNLKIDDLVSDKKIKKSMRLTAGMIFWALVLLALMIPFTCKK